MCASNSQSVAECALSKFALSELKRGIYRFNKNGKSYGFGWMNEKDLGRRDVHVFSTNVPGKVPLFNRNRCLKSFRVRENFSLWKVLVGKLHIKIDRVNAPATFSLSFFLLRFPPLFFPPSSARSLCLVELSVNFVAILGKEGSFSVFQIQILSVKFYLKRLESSLFPVVGMLNVVLSFLTFL